MSILSLPVRYYRDYAPHYDYAYETLSLPLERTAFLIVDIDDFGYIPYREHTEQHIASPLHAARTAGIRVAYVFNDGNVASDGNANIEVWGRTKGLKRDPAQVGKFREPQYVDSVRPLPEERVFRKWIWSGFHDTFLDQHLRAHDIKTLICVGYSLRACLYGTLIDAVYHNYRVIVLRDAVLAPEQPDTEDATMPEGGWINRIMIRQVEHLIGYTSTVAEFAAACRAVTQVSVAAGC
ncbi:MAG: cysteine hydrolase [Anaerolineae bacterium]|nr:cysteine hydrolase [Anaerolineae bacterium]